MNMSAAAPVSAPAAASATAPSKTAMMFMRASSKAQQDKGKDLSVSIENLKAELSGLQLNGMQLLDSMRRVAAGLQVAAREGWYLRVWFRVFCQCAAKRLIAPL